MTDEIDKPAGGGRQDRQDRLKSALRENLKRRKLQVRERSNATEPSANDEASPRDEIAGKPGGASRE